jgi:hypothetical protein
MLLPLKVPSLPPPVAVDGMGRAVGYRLLLVVKPLNHRRRAGGEHSYRPLNSQKNRKMGGRRALANVALPRLEKFRVVTQLAQAIDKAGRTMRAVDLLGSDHFYRFDQFVEVGMI